MIDFKEIEERMLKFWDENEIYQKAKKKNENAKKFYFLQGPPYTSGKIHIGHAWNNSLKDIAMRFFRKKGFDVWDRAGYDMHGLPTANKVQSQLGLKDKEEIVNYGLDKFNSKCKEFSVESMKNMNQDLRRLGIWMDFDNAYMPVSNEFMSSEWLLFKKADEQNRLYKGEKIMHWCGECETSLAKHELEYESVSDDSVFLKFPLKGKEDEYLVVWTTTPWTIPYNLAVMVGPDIDYVELDVDVKEGNREKWVVAKALSGVLVGGLLGLDYKISREFKGKEMEGMRYVHPFYPKMSEVYDELRLKAEKVHSVVLSEEYVDTSAGSGLVHCAPGCGPEDYEVGKRNGIMAFNSVNEKGQLEDVGEFSGFFAKKDDDKFVDALDEVGSLIKKTPVEHEYAHCWRCGSPVVFKTTKQWFLKIEDLVPKILDYNKNVLWQPESCKKSYESWISNLRDNGVTRQRFWGTPMPVWECECGKYEVVGSKEELQEKAIGGEIPTDLHKPWIDEVRLKCECGREMSRVPDVVDVWIDSGTVSWNCLYYPQRSDLLEKFYPADLILEATEQTRLWFSMLQLCSTILFGKQAYEGAYNHGMMLDFQGMKMSKSMGNIISPYEVIDKFSSEILRYYICEVTAGKNVNFSWEDVKQKQKNLFVLFNSAKYLLQLGNEGEDAHPGIEEKYLVSRVNSAIKLTTSYFEDFRFDLCIIELEKLFLDISRIYIKLTRDKASSSPGLVKKYLLWAYKKVLGMFSVVCPLFSENIYQMLREKDLVNLESVQLEEWPEFSSEGIDLDLEDRISFVLMILEQGFYKRDKAQIGLKWPLKSAVVYSKRRLEEGFCEIIKNQLNIKEVFFEDSDDFDVVLDLGLTPELEAEGFSREIVRKVQAGRKKAGFVKEDIIELFVESDFDDYLRSHQDYIIRKVGARSLSFGGGLNDPDYSDSGKIKGRDYSFSFSRA